MVGSLPINGDYSLLRNQLLLKRGIWVYLLLLIFEGALRKWVLPFLATPLLIVRDPVALWLLLAAWKFGFFRWNGYSAAMIVLSLIGIVTAVLIGHGNLYVALYGARLYILHFPVMFVIGTILNYEDVVQIGRTILKIAIPMAILIALQFYSPQSAWVNRGIGGNMEGGGFSGALGYFRPPGTFSFTNGNTLFFSLVAPFVFYFWLNAKEINRLILILATIALLAAIPLSISRTLFFSVTITALFSVFTAVTRPQNAGKLMLAFVLVLAVFFMLSQISAIDTALNVFTHRFEGANKAEGGLEGVVGDRYFGAMIYAISGSYNIPFFGFGLGAGTSVGAMLVLGTAGLQFGEDEWTRITGEMGFLIGILVILTRLLFTLNLLTDSFRRMKSGRLLPWMLVSFCVLNIPQGQWAQPTSLGFSVLAGGLVLAALKK
ncbi:hypothetical protein [Tellurirhabdus rosea]|uniref:hypothetical protein n=1 Tax=Tellurirhabdus rosea TaxID=2674997 RepID=UPI002258C929|nr:hypothetical protein [Tellurirhabdus rosea]